MKFFRIFLIIATILTLGFIWGHSMVPQEGSSAESGLVKDMLDDFLSFGSDNSFDISEKLVRKAAHFIEYAFLGLELSLFFLTGSYGAKALAVPFRIYIQTGVFCLCTALIDETIQIFSGRYPSLFDVSLDFLGSSVAIWIVILIFTLAKHKRSSNVVSEGTNDF